MSTQTWMRPAVTACLLLEHFRLTAESQWLTESDCCEKHRACLASIVHFHASRACRQNAALKYGCPIKLIAVDDFRGDRARTGPKSLVQVAVGLVGLDPLWLLGAVCGCLPVGRHWHVWTRRFNLL